LCTSAAVILASSHTLLVTVRINYAKALRRKTRWTAANCLTSGTSGCCYCCEISRVLLYMTLLWKSEDVTT